MSETSALTRMAFEELRDATGGIGGIHRGIADRVFGFVGPRAKPVEVAHRAIAGGVYAAIGGAVGLAGRAAELGAAARPAGEISQTPRGAALIAAINGLIGDRLLEEGNEIAETMTVRVNGAEVSLDHESVARAFPAATPRIVVFLHGLMESEFGWWLGGGRSYGERLADDLACTPVYLRYNTGRHISENGAELAELLEELVAVWPVGVEEIALVGHSMGGLVARSAAHQAAGKRWVRLVRHFVSLGSPHFGAPLAQAVHYASAALHAAPETRPLGAFLRRRSAGIRDLRHGSLVDDDWRDHDPDALMRVVCQEVPLLEGATHCFVSASVTRSPRHPVARLIGDWLVLEASASGRSRARRIPFKAEHGLHVGGTHHLALLNHPTVYESLRKWLATPPAPGRRRRLLGPGR